MKQFNTKLKHGDRIVAIRNRHNLSQLDLAVELDISKETISKIERNLTFLQADKALILYNQYGYSLEWIYGLSDEEYPTDPKFMIDFRNFFSIKNVKKLFLKESTFTTRKTPVLTITLGANQLNYLHRIAELEEAQNDGTLTEDEFETLVYRAEETFKKSPYSHYFVGEISTDLMEEFSKKISSETIPTYIP